MSAVLRFHNDNFPFVLWTAADMNRSIVSIKIQSVEQSMLHDPLRYFEHTFVSDEKVDCGAKTRANRFSSTVQFMASMLIKGRSNPTGNVFGQVLGTKAVR